MGKEIEISANGAAMKAYLAEPPGGEGPGVLVLQEWWGLVPHIRDVCDRLAAEGFHALSPDLYHGDTTDSPDEAGRLMMALDVERASKDLLAAGRRLAESASGPKIGVIGFCMGGQLALFSACQDEAIGACVDFYGIHPNVKPDLKRLRAPVLGFFGETDGFVSPDKARALEENIREAGGAAEFHVFPGVGHAFYNDSRPDGYDETAAHEAHRRMVAFLKKHLGG